MKEQEVEKINEYEIAKRLSRKYPQPAYAFITRVRNQTGYSKNTRTADALAMSLWPSRGFSLEGFEIKVSRTDWLKELSDPQKADDIAQFCNYWWLVVHDAKIINLSEIPKKWGLIVSGKNGNKVIKDADYQEATAPDHQLLAGILRNVTENFIHKDDVNARIDDAKETWEQHGNYDLKRAKEDLQKIANFTQASGIDPLKGWNEEKKIGTAVNLILGMKSELDWRFKSAYTYLKEAVEKFEKAGIEMGGILQLQDAVEKSERRKRKKHKPMHL